jgi:hypothetical protein
MSTPIGIGNFDQQMRFLQRNRPYLEEWRLLQTVVEQAYLNRVIEPPDEEIIARLVGLPEDHPEVMTVEDKYKTDLTVYILGRTAVDDFSELVILAGNGWGIGALKILRGMYERIVTSAYIAKNPQVSRSFVDSLWIHKEKVWKRAVALAPSLASKPTQEQVTNLEAEAKRARDRRSESFCKACGQIKKVEAWTQLDLASMAKIAGKSFEDLYLPCYLEPTAHMHATGAGVDARIEHKENAWAYRLDTTKEAQMALHLGHNLILGNLVTQNDYFRLGLDQALQPRFEAFVRIWESGIWGNAASGNAAPEAT